MRMNPEDSVNSPCPDVVSVDASSVVVDAPTAISKPAVKGQHPNSVKNWITAERYETFVKCCAKRKNGKGVCLAPARKNRLGVYTRCRIHGGNNPGPAIGSQHALKHGKRCRTVLAIKSKLDSTSDPLKAIADITSDE